MAAAPQTPASLRPTEIDDGIRLKYPLHSYLCWALIASLGILGFLPVCRGEMTACLTSLLWALACTATGMLLGFFFGIPKVLQGKDPARGLDGAKNSEPRYDQEVNTNLEQISDWLCKIIVGVGLIELRVVPEKLGLLASTLARDLGNGYTQSFAGALILYFSVAGFFYGYLITRLFLSTDFRNADLKARGEEIRIQYREMQIKTNEIVAEHQRNIEKIQSEIEANELLIALERGKKAQSSRDADDIKNAIDDLVARRKRWPEHRRAAMVLSTLYGLQGNPQAAVAVLDDALQAKAIRGTDQDLDAGDMHFNRAGFYSRIYLNPTNTEAVRQEARAKLLDAMRLAVKFNPANSRDAGEDEDLKRMMDDPEFLQIVSHP